MDKPNKNNQQNNEKNERKTKANGELLESNVRVGIEDESSAFKRQSRISRSPVGTPIRAAENRSQRTQGDTPVIAISHGILNAENVAKEDTGSASKENAFHDIVSRKLSGEREVELTPTTSATPSGMNQAENNHSSPNQKFIAKMRMEETSAISHIKKSLLKMKKALQRQRNISMDVREGIQEIEELVCIAETCRANWLQTEKEKKSKQSKSTVVAAQESNETPKISNTKRAASSPAEAIIVKKKPHDIEHTEWQTVARKSKAMPKELEARKGMDKVPHAQRSSGNKDGKSTPARKRLPRRKTDAIIAKPCEGFSYADVLKTLKDQTGNDFSSKVRTIRKTRTGALLLQLENKEQISPEILKNIQEKLKESAEIKSITPRATIEIRDLDSLTTAEEVAKSIRSTVQINNESMTVRITKPNSRELVRAFVTVSYDIAEELLKTEYIKVGWCRARLKKYENVNRCFRCFGIGHVQWKCTGPDRKSQGICIRCGKAGHMMRTCKNDPKCCLCKEEGHANIDHVAGSKNCSTAIRDSK